MCVSECQEPGLDWLAGYPATQSAKNLNKQLDKKAEKFLQLLLLLLDPIDSYYYLYLNIYTPSPVRVE